MKLISISLSLLLLSLDAYADHTRVESFHQAHRQLSPHAPHRMQQQMRPVYPRPMYRPSQSQYRNNVVYRNNPYIRPYQAQRYISQQPRRVYQERVGMYDRGYTRTCETRPIVHYPRPVYRYRVGEMIGRLPQGAYPIVVDDRRYYQYEETYFQPRRRDGVQMYLVVNF